MGVDIRKFLMMNVIRMKKGNTRLADNYFEELVKELGNPLEMTKSLSVVQLKTVR